MKKNKKAFTLIELIAVLVILSLVALIVTPLVMNILKRSKESVNRRSVDAYGKALELSVASYLLQHKEYPDSLFELKVEYSGNEVICKTQKLNEDGSIYLSECSVNGILLKDEKTEDGYYHYGKIPDTKPEEPVVYQKYSIGDVVTYNGMNFYVIENSDESKDSVTLLKAEPLTVDEVNTYGGVGTENNHVNRYTYSSIGKACDIEGYGGMAYYSSATCGYVKGLGENFDGCTTEYELSDVKYIVDAWTNDKLNSSDLTEDSLGYKTRLITFDDLINNLGYENKNTGVIVPSSNGSTPMWIYNINSNSHTMSQYNNHNYELWIIRADALMDSSLVYNYALVLRPVITLLKSTI